MRTNMETIRLLLWVVMMCHAANATARGCFSVGGKKCSGPDRVWPD